MLLLTSSCLVFWVFAKNKICSLDTFFFLDYYFLIRCLCLLNCVSMLQMWLIFQIKFVFIKFTWYKALTLILTFVQSLIHCKEPTNTNHFSQAVQCLSPFPKSKTVLGSDRGCVEFRHVSVWVSPACSGASMNGCFFRLCVSPVTNWRPVQGELPLNKCQKRSDPVPHDPAKDKWFIHEWHFQRYLHDSAVKT